VRAGLDHQEVVDLFVRLAGIASPTGAGEAPTPSRRIRRPRSRRPRGRQRSCQAAAAATSSPASPAEGGARRPVRPPRHRAGLRRAAVVNTTGRAQRRRHGAGADDKAAVAVLLAPPARSPAACGDVELVHCWRGGRPAGRQRADLTGPLLGACLPTVTARRARHRRPADTEAVTAEFHGVASHSGIALRRGATPLSRRLRHREAAASTTTTANIGMATGHGLQRRRRTLQVWLARRAAGPGKAATLPRRWCRLAAEVGRPTTSRST
jgi:hypothetical protein